MNRCPARLKVSGPEAHSCGREIGEDMVACSQHWFALPPELRSRVWNLYRREKGSEAHRAAVFEAIRLLVGG